MNHTLTLFIIGLAIAVVGVLIFFGGTRLLDRQTGTLGGISSCLLALFGAVVIFLGGGIVIAAFFVE